MKKKFNYNNHKMNYLLLHNLPNNPVIQSLKLFLDLNLYLNYKLALKITKNLKKENFFYLLKIN